MSFSLQLNYGASVLAVLKAFGCDIEQFNGPKVHSLQNVMTMESDVHDWFNRSEIWFEKTKVTNCYKLYNIYPQYQRRLPTDVTFTAPDKENLPVPSETLLTLHAICARVARLFGAAEYIDNVDRDVEDLGVLAYNGVSGDVLISALLNCTNEIASGKSLLLHNSEPVSHSTM
ncbi:hypothetical protein IW262DRAFT_1276026 [Armillaria fumosa]|nr:hypothetical protein IW262DRAFT_1276026 [Armillaria fumosa]